MDQEFFISYKLPGSGSFKSAKEALRWAIGLLNKCASRFEEHGEVAAPDSREKDLLASCHAQAILIDELLRGY